MNKIYFALLAIFFSGSVFGQLTVDPNISAPDLAQILVGEGVVIDNVQVTGADSAWGYFNSIGTGIGTAEGLILSTGRISNAVGPNNSSGLPQIDSDQNCLNCDEFDFDLPGNDLLDVLSGENTTDAVSFEFDVFPRGDSLKFAFTFASEEYAEWVGSSFNDVFGFFISGPNVGTDVNIAVVPGTNTPITINSINNGLNNNGPCENCDFYYNNINPLGQDIQYDGYTLDLVAEIGNLIPCEAYTLKLILADGSDGIYDSAVLVEQIESNPITISTATQGGSEEMIEGCNNGIVTFSRPLPSPDPQTVTYFVGGTATNGVDYTPQLGTGNEEDPIEIIIPADETSVSIDINPILDGIAEGSEIITIYLANPLCDNTTLVDSVNFTILDVLPIDILPDNPAVCEGQCIELSAESLDGNISYEWTPAIGLDQTTGQVVEACPLMETTYTVEATLAACVESSSETVTVSMLEIALTPNTVNCESSSDGQVDLTVTNGIAPYTFEWTGPGGFTSTDEDISGLEPGEYCVTITDDAGCTGTACATVAEENVLDISNVTFSDYGCFPISCNGASDGSITIEVAGGSGNYSASWNTTPVQSGFSAVGLSAGTYTVTVSDDAGCEVVQSFTIAEPDLVEIQVSGQVDLLCTGASTGLATVTSTGGCAPYFYSWSHDPNLQTPIATDLPSGDYTVTVTDVNGCTSAGSVTVTINDPQDPVTATLIDQSVYAGGFNISCFGAADGTGTLDISGGTPSYSVTWLNTDNGDQFFQQNPTNLTCGNYIVTVVDGTECDFTLEVEYTCPPEITLSFATVSNPCSDPNAGVGEIDITVSGGQGPGYTFSWTGPDGFVANTEDITGLITGTYCVTVTDELGCTLEQCITLPLTDDIEIDAVVVDATCGNDCNGAITINPSGGSGNFTIEWDGFPEFDDLTTLNGICPGNYLVTVTDDSGCFQIESIAVGGPDPIEILPLSVSPPSCFGNNDGSITIAIQGGSGNFGIEWVGFPANDDNFSLNTLGDGSYVINVEDLDTGCLASDTIALVAPQVMEIFVEVSQFDGGFNISCNGENDGQINVTINGGTPDCTVFDPFCYNYDWSSGADISPNDPNSNNITDLSPGTYVINVTDINGCLATTSIPILEPAPLDASGLVTPTGCVGQCAGAIDATALGGSGNLSNINWVGTNQTGLSVDSLCPGTYTLQLTDSNNCVGEVDFVLEEPDADIEVTVDALNAPMCFEGTDGSISTTISGGTGNLFIEWDGPDNPYPSEEDLFDIGSGIYILTVTDENGCEVEETIILQDPPLFDVTLFVPTLEDAPFTIPCAGGTADTLIATIIGGVSPFDIVWTVNGFEDPAFVPSDLAPGTYCIEVTDAMNCVQEACFEITAPDDELVVTAIVNDVSCGEDCTGFIDLTTTGGVGPYTVIWRDDLENEIAFTEDVEDLCEGDYSVVVEDANGCIITQFYTVTTSTSIGLVATLSDYSGFGVSCNGSTDGSIELIAEGGTPTYIFSIDGEVIGTNPVTGLAAGTYILSVVDENGCTGILEVELSEPDPITLNEELSNVSCFGSNDGSIVLDPQGAGTVTVSWDNGESGFSITDLEPGTYCATATDANNCSLTECFDILEGSEIEVVALGTDPTCGLNNGSIDVTTTGGDGALSFDWSGPNTVNDQEDQTGLGAGNYTVVVSDENGCAISTSLVLVGDNITDNTIVNDASCFGESDGSIDLNLAGLGAPISYNWTGPDGNLGTSEDLNDLPAGEYSVEVSFGADGCVGNFSYEVGSPEEIEVLASIFEYGNGLNVSQIGIADGLVDLEISNGTEPYTVEWEGPSDIVDGTLNATGLAAGDYSITVTDANGCSTVLSITLTGEEEFALPNGITPNGDGFNDVFFILGLDGFPNNQLTVYNRWGNKVFEQSNYDNTWNGLNQEGEPLTEGTYFVIFEAGDEAFETYVDLRR